MTFVSGFFDLAHRVYGSSTLWCVQYFLLFHGQIIFLHLKTTLFICSLINGLLRMGLL